MNPQISPIEIGGIIGVVIILSQGLVGITKLVINKKLNGKKEVSPLTKEQEKQLQGLFDMHAKFDNDGIPLWFMPRSWGETQKEIAEIIHQIASDQKQHTKILDKVLEKLN